MVYRHMVKFITYKDTVSLMNELDKVLGGNDFHPKGVDYSMSRKCLDIIQITITTND